ncbi:MAG: DUF4835 family protein [Bacteroidia bacterium]
MRKLLSIILVILSSISIVSAQELNCQVSVVSPAISVSATKLVLQTLQTSIFDFMNNTRFTNDVFKNDERIECSILINVTQQVSTDQFQATIQIQSRRPVYKSSYNSTMINFIDQDFEFSYLQYQPMEFVKTTVNPNLMSVLAFYAYTIIGMDYDSYSLNGGSPYFQQAQTIVNNMQNAAEKGWKPYESDRNRYWLIENILDPYFKPLRECIYRYHRLGLDIMSDNKDAGRAVILQSLQLLQKVNNDKPGSFGLQFFFNAKSDEIVNIFKQAYPEEKTKVVSVLTEVDPANSNKYDTITGTQ